MQISNNYQPNFMGGKIDKQGLEVLSHRLPSGQFQKFIDRFEARHKDYGYKITLGAGVGIKDRLDAMIHYGKDHFRYLEEGVISSIFSSPKKFMKRINRQISKDITSIASKGHVD